MEDKFGVDDFLDISYFTNPDEIETEIEETDLFKMVDHAGVDSINSMIPMQLNEMTEMQWQQWCDFNYAICKERTINGMSSHGLLICKKQIKSAQ